MLHKMYLFSEPQVAKERIITKLSLYGILYQLICKSVTIWKVALSKDC